MINPNVVRLLLVCLSIAVLAALSPRAQAASLRPHHQQALTSCAPDTASARQLAETVVGAFLNRSDSLAIRIRRQVHLPSSAGAGVLAVQDSIVCRRVRSAIDSLSGLAAHPALAQSDSTRSLIVFAVDTLYVAIDVHSAQPHARSDWQVFTHDFRRLGMWR